MIKQLMVVLLIMGAHLAHAASISGTIMLDSTWHREIYLSLINDFDEMNMASDDLIIGSAVVDSNGQFAFNDLILADEDRIYRLHVCKQGDPVSTIVIGGREHNHIHFILQRNASLVLVSDKGNALFHAVELQGYPPNVSLQHLWELQAAWKSSKARGQRERELIDATYWQQLMAMADTCSNQLVALFAIQELEWQGVLEQEQAWLASWLSQQATTSIYLEALQRQFQVLQWSPEAEGSMWWWGAGLVLVIGIGVLLVLRSRKPSFVDLGSLTLKEREVFELLRTGLSNKEIAATLHVEQSTIKSHINNIYTKLEVKSRTEIMDLKLPTKV